MRPIVAAVLAVVLTLSSPPLSRAQSPARESVAPVSTPNVVVLDVALVFKSHVRFKQRMEEVRRDIDRFDKEFAQERQTIVGQGARLKDFKSGSPEYREIEERISRELAELRIKTVSRKNELLEREGRIYHETYQQIVAAVTHLADRYGFSLVVRYDSESIDSSDGGSIFKAINRDVVHQRGLDISKLVIEQVNNPPVVATTGGGTSRR